MSLPIGLALLIWLVAVTLMLIGTWLALRGFRSSPPHLDAPFGLYPVSILKPLKGADVGLYENLKGFFELDYPQYELLFSVADPNDPARAVAEALMWQYPGVRAKLIIGQVDVGPNPKVNNMIRSYEQARYELLLISDSNVRVGKDYLKRLVAHLDNDVGVVTSVVAGRGAGSAGGRLESVYLNTFYARWMYLTGAFDQHCVVGKSMLFSKKTAERFGGLRALGAYLAEDYMAGVAVRRLGLKVELAVDPIVQHVGVHSLSQFWKRHLRWGRIRKSQAVVAFACEPLMGCLTSGFVGAWAFYSAFAVPVSTFLTLHLGVWAACDLALARVLDPAVRMWLPVSWFLREFLSLPLWLHTALGNTVLWRGKRFALLAGGLLESSEGR